MIGGSLGMALKKTGEYSVDFLGKNKENFNNRHYKLYDFIFNCTGREISIGALHFSNIFIDISSVQGGINQYESNNIFCHPICGSEKSGRENAKADLFQGKTCIITTENKEQDLIAFATNIFTDIGMDVQFCETVEEHNKNLAYTSHLIQYLAFNDNFKTLHPVFERLSDSNKEMWGKIFKENKVNIQNALEDLFGIYVSQQTPSISEAFKILVKDIPKYFHGTALKEIIN